MTTSSIPTATARSEAKLAPASVVRAVSVRMVGGALRVIIEADGAVQFKDFTLNGPSRIVIDLAGVRSALGSKTIPVASGPAERVRVGEPSPGSVRIVIDVATLTRYRIIRDGSSLVVTIGEDGVAAGSGTR